MELFLESQVTFSSLFLKTFVDHLVWNQQQQQQQQQQQKQASFSSNDYYYYYYNRQVCDWFLTLIIPTLIQIAIIACYIPIRRYGYQTMYSILLSLNVAVSVGMCLLLLLATATVSSSSSSTEAMIIINEHQRPQYFPFLVLLFLIISPVLTGAIQASGFHLAMSDLVTEMKWRHSMQPQATPPPTTTIVTGDDGGGSGGNGSSASPSLAALCLGISALVCKPVESALVMVASTSLEASSSTNDNVNSYYFWLLGPPLILSMIQLWAWKQYSLTPARVHAMRVELLQVKQQQQQQYQWNGTG